MVKLTEEMVIARTKQSNLGMITKLNCWGAQLSDVTILRRMPNVTVLSLSVNSINSLADFQYCKKLQDLFVRKNNIKALNEVCYLQDLTHLKSLWLDQNPCVENPKDEFYRLSVIRALPQLKKLDDAAVEPSELDKSQKFGKVLVHPEQQAEYYSDPDDDSGEQASCSDERENEIGVRGHPGWVHPQQQPSQETVTVYSEPERDTPEPQYRPQELSQNNINHEIEQEVALVEEKNSATLIKPSGDFQREPEVLTRSSSFKSEDNMDVYNPPANMRQVHYNSIPRSRTTDGNELSYCNEYRRYNRGCINNCGGSRRPVDRKTNILNAVLCLIKELDIHNLEVVEMAVKCRMDELEN